MINSWGSCAQANMVVMIKALPKLQKHHPSIRRYNERQSLTAAEFGCGRKEQ